MVDLKKIANDAQIRCKEAERIADSFKGNDELHRLGMMAVFLMEDIAFDLLQMSESAAPPIGKKAFKEPPS